MKRLYKKALRDLVGNPSRLLTALLAIVTGSVAFGSVTFTSSVLAEEIIHVYDATNPASGALQVDHVDDALLKLTEDYDGIVDYEVKAAYELRMEKPDGAAKSLLLFAAPDLSALRLNTLQHIDGKATPGPGEVLLEADALGVADVRIGDALPIRLPDGTVQNYTVVGTVNDLSQHPPSMHNQVYAYTSVETLADMGLPMNTIDYFVQGDIYDRDNILQTTTGYIQALEAGGYSVTSVNISGTPGVSMHLEEYEGALFILGAFSILAFVFGCVIMSSLLSTMLAGQVRQIGILKALGAKTGQVRGAYMAAAALLAALNLAAALPLSMRISKLLSGFLLRLGNMYLTDFVVPVWLCALFAAALLLAPLVLSYPPIHRGLSVPVQEALADYGIRAKRRSTPGKWIAGVLSRLPRPTSLSLRGALAHRRRFLMNVSMLTLGGLLFVGIMGTIVSINTALSDNMKARHFDYQFTTGDYTDMSQISAAMGDATELADAWEVWGSATARLIYGDGGAGNLYSMTALSCDTALFFPEIMEGRWLEQGDTDAIVVSFEFLGNEPYGLGDAVTFQLGDTTRTFTIVGVVKEIGTQSIYMERQGFEQIVPAGSRRSLTSLATAPQNKRMRLVYHELEEYLKGAGISIVQSEAGSERYSILTAHFTTTLVSFLTVAVMVICVAGFGLASTMNLQVAERTREIGIMKAMGANDKQVRSIVRAESTFVCLVSWLVSVLLAAPVLLLGIYFVGVHVLEIPLALPPGAVIISLLAWLALTWLVGRLASRASGKRAARVTVHAALMQ